MSLPSGSVDAHVHVGGSYASINAWHQHATAFGISGAVLVQEVALVDNRELIATSEAAGPDHWAIVRVDENDPEVTEQLHRLAAHPVVRGVRLYGATRSPGADPYAIWRVISDLGLVASVRGPLADLVDDGFAELLAEVPALTLRLEHLGFHRFAEETPADFSRLCELSDNRQVHLMWSGQYANAGSPWPYDNTWPALRESLHAFGAERIMWSGDWNAATLLPDRPSDAVAHDTELLLDPRLRDTVGLTDTDLELIMCRTVRHFLQES